MCVWIDAITQPRCTVNCHCCAIGQCTVQNDYTVCRERSSDVICPIDTKCNKPVKAQVVHAWSPPSAQVVLQWSKTVSSSALCNSFAFVTNLRCTAPFVHYDKAQGTTTTFCDTCRVVTENLPTTHGDLQKYQIMLLLLPDSSAN